MSFSRDPHADEVRARREEINDSSDYLSKIKESAEIHRHEHAEHMAEIRIQDKRSSASSLTKMVDSVRSRKELYDAIDESEKNFRHHEMELKNELAAANRADNINRIIEKQASLQ
jgi:rubrerythrin